MVQELRARISDEAYAALKAICEEQHLKIPQVLHAALAQFQTPSRDEETKLDTVLLQLQRVQAMLEAILAQSRDTPEKAPVPIATEEQLYGPIVRQVVPAEEQIPEAFRMAPPKRGLLTRLLYKEEE